MTKYIILGHENPDVDSIVSGYIYQNYLQRRNIDAEFVIPDEAIEEDTLEICRKFNLEPTDFQKELTYDENTKFILVDHHNHKNINNICLIIDHHPDNTIPESDNYINESASSTSCLIVQRNEMFYTTQEIELACMAAMVDTASFHSTKAKPQDLNWIEKMVQERNLNFNKLYEAGLNLSSLEDKEKAMFHGLKNHNINGNKIESSTIHLLNIKNHWNKINEIIELLKNYLLDKELDYFIFIIHDLQTFESFVYTISKTDIISKKYDQYVSRGTTIIPHLEENLKQKKKIKESTDN